MTASSFGFIVMQNADLEKLLRTVANYFREEENNPTNATIVVGDQTVTITDHPNDTEISLKFKPDKRILKAVKEAESKI